jgi:hypothetical protein
MKLIVHSRNVSCFLTRYNVCTLKVPTIYKKTPFVPHVNLRHYIHYPQSSHYALLPAVFWLLPTEELLRTAQLNERNEATERRGQTMRVVSCRDIDRVTRRLTPGHSTHSNFIYGMRGYSTVTYIAKPPVGLWGPPSHALNEKLGPSLWDKAEGLPGWPLNFIDC